MINPIAVKTNIIGRFMACVSALITLLAIVGCSTTERLKTNLAQDVLRSYKAEEIPRPTGPVSIDEAVVLALKHNPELRVAREELRVVETLRTGAVQIKDPELRFSYGNSSDQHDRYVTMPLTNAPWILNDRNGQPITDFPYGSAASYRVTKEDAKDYQISARFFPPNPWLIKDKIRAADAAIAAAQANVAALEWNTAMAVRASFARTRQLQTDINFIDRLITLGSNTISLIEIRVGQGTATLLDIVNASGIHLALINDRSVAERNCDAAIQELANLMGVGASDVVIIPSDERIQAFDPTTVDTAYLESIAVRNRLDLAARILELRSAEAALTQAESELSPWITFLQASIGNNSATSLLDPNMQWTGTDGFNSVLPSVQTEWENSQGTSWRIDAGLTIPLFSLMTPLAVPQKAEIMRRVSAVSAAVKRIVADVRDAVKNLQTASANLERYSRTSSRDAALLGSILNKSAQQGTLGPYDRAKIETALLEVQRSTSKLEYEYRQAYMSLTTRVGRDLSFLWDTRPDERSTEPKKRTAVMTAPIESTSTNAPIPQHPVIPDISSTTSPVITPAANPSPSVPLPITIAIPLQPIKAPAKTSKPAKIANKIKANSVLLELMSRRQAEWNKPVVEVPVPVVEVPAPVVEVPAPVVEVPAPVVEVPAPVVEVPAPVVEVPAPVVE